jgi:hypothetical protein
MLKKKDIYKYLNIETAMIEDIIDIHRNGEEINEKVQKFYYNNYKDFINYYVSLSEKDKNNFLNLYNEEKEIALKYIRENNPEKYKGLNTLTILLNIKNQEKSILNYIEKGYPLELSSNDKFRFKSIEEALEYAIDFLYYGDNENVENNETFIKILKELKSKGIFDKINQKNKNLIKTVLLNDNLYDFSKDLTLKMDKNSTDKNYFYSVLKRTHETNIDKKIRILINLLNNDCLLFKDENPEKIKPRNNSPEFCIESFMTRTIPYRNFENNKELFLEFFEILTKRLLKNDEISVERIKANNPFKDLNFDEGQIMTDILNNLNIKEQEFFLLDDKGEHKLLQDTISFTPSFDDKQDLVKSLLNISYYTEEKIEEVIKEMEKNNSYCDIKFICALINDREDIIFLRNPVVKDFILNRFEELSYIENSKRVDMTKVKIEKAIIAENINKTENNYTNKKRL